MKMQHLATDPRFAEQNVRSENVDQIDAIVAAWTRSHDLEEVERILEAASVPASRIFTMADIFRDPHFSARDMLLEVPDDDLGTVTLAGIVPKLSGTPGSVVWSGHRTGQDTREILKRFAHLSDQEIDTLERDKVVFCEPQQSDQAIPASATL
jgi:crotonobetainyl-CoA:carnitine CoA-transferase CaiB-like acyl-CoA transferase